MKIDRQIGILSVLLQKDKVTAEELSEKFEVSRRTVIRDIEDLNRAGIPVVTIQGKGGGISVMEGYRFNRTLLSRKDMKSILTGLKSLDSVSGTNHYRCLMEKISANDYAKSGENHILIDLSGWDKSIVSSKIELLQFAIENRKKITFKYFSPTNESIRIIEPYHIIFQWSNWYIWGFCTKRQDYRMFKLTRMTDLECTDEKCEDRDVPEFTRNNRWNSFKEINALVKFDKSVKWRVIDEFGADILQYDENGDLLLNYTSPDLHSLFYHMLSFGDKAEIIDPPEYRKEFLAIIEKVAEKYK